MIKPVQIVVVIVVLHFRTDAFGETPREQCLTVGQCYDVKHDDDDPSFPQGLDLETREFEVPVIDVAALMAPQLYSTTQWNKTAAVVARACEDWGFFQVTEYPETSCLEACHVITHLPQGWWLKFWCRFVFVSMEILDAHSTDRTAVTLTLTLKIAVTLTLTLRIAVYTSQFYADV